MSLLAVFTWGQTLLGVGVILICTLLILVILVQQASGGGLVGAFGGGGGGGAFGAKTGDVFTVITCALAGLYLLLSVVGNYVFEPVAPVSAQVVVAPSPTSDVPDAPQPGSSSPATQPTTQPSTPAGSGAAGGQGASPPSATSSGSTTPSSSGAQPPGDEADDASAPSAPEGGR